MNNLNITTDLQSVIHQYTSEDSMIEEFSKDPKNLIKLFECASNKENHWHVTNSTSFDKIFKKIEVLDSEGKLDEEQVQKIISINEDIYPSITDSTLRRESTNFFSNHLNDDNVYDHLYHAVNIKADDYIRKCLDYIENKTKNKFTINDSLLTIDPSSSNISMDELSKHVAILATILNNQIAITLKPINSSDLAPLENFIRAQGKFITTLDLKNLENSIDDSFTDMAIKSCPNLTSLFINSDKINGNGLSELSSLWNLKELDLDGCSNLTALPDLPKALSTLNLFKCTRLKALPALPETLTTFNLSFSPLLKTLPALPKTLSTLNLFRCRDMTAIPALPEALRTLHLRNCLGLTALPTLPEALSTLDLSQCSSLTALPNLPETLSTLNLSECHSLTALPALPEALSTLKLIKCTGLTALPALPVALSTLNLSMCESLTALPTLPEALSTLNLSMCESLTALPVLPKTLSTLDLSRCSDLKALPVLPEALRTLNLSECRGLKALPTLPETLSMLNLFECRGLKALPALPETLSTLDISGCPGLTAFPALPETLSTLNISGCRGLTEDLRLSVLAKMFDRNFDQGLTLYKSYEIEDIDKLFKLIAEQLIGKIESKDYKPLFFDALEKKLSDQTTLPSTQNLLAKFIFDNQRSLGLHDEHPLAQEAIMVMSAFSIEGENNPFSVFKKLNELSKIPSEFSPQPMTVEGSWVAINMDRLAKLSKAAIIKREVLPKNATREAFETLAADLRRKCEENADAIKALENLGTTWATISTPIFGDSSQYLVGLLDLSGENVSDSEAKWKAVLAWVLDKESVPRDNTFFSEQEETFIKVMMGIQACKGGKDMGIALTYEWLEPKYQYQLALTKPAATILEEQKEIERNEAITFLNDNFVKNQTLNMTEDMINKVKDFGTKNLKAVYPLVYGEEFWDEDEDYNYNLSDKGAIEILTALNEAKENENLPVKQFIGAIIRKLIARQFTGTNALMKTIMDLPLNKAEQEELLSGKFDVVDDDMLKNLKDKETEDIVQGAHYAIYLENLIGHLVGASSKVTFDRYTGVLKAPLLDRKREEVLETFSQFVTPKRLVDEIVKVVNVNPRGNDFLSPYLSDDVYPIGEYLTRKAALSLLEQLGYLKKS